MYHHLKILPEYFIEVIKGTKTFELRQNDRDYKIGDKIMLHEITPNNDQDTGYYCSVEILYILPRYDMALINNYCILAIKLLLGEKIYISKEHNQIFSKFLNDRP